MAAAGGRSGLGPYGLNVSAWAGGPADPEQAVEWFAKAATSSLPNAQLAAQMLSEFYERGLHGVAKDPIRAEFWKQNFQAWRDSFRAEELSDHLLQRGFEGFPERLSSKVLGHIMLNHLMNSADLETVRELLRRGADPNFACPDDGCFNGTTALSWSSENFEILKLLVEYGARVPFECGQKAILCVHQACERGRLDILRFLVEKAEGTAALQLYDDSYMTPLTIAATEGHVEIVDYLLNQGVDPNEHIDDTALAVAARGGHTSVVKRLQRATSHQGL